MTPKGLSRSFSLNQLESYGHHSIVCGVLSHYYALFGVLRPASQELAESPALGEG